MHLLQTNGFPYVDQEQMTQQLNKFIAWKRINWISNIQALAVGLYIYPHSISKLNAYKKRVNSEQILEELIFTNSYIFSLAVGRKSESQQCIVGLKPIQKFALVTI